MFNKIMVLAVCFLFVVAIPMATSAAPPTKLVFDAPTTLVNSDPIPAGYIDHFNSRCRISGGSYINVTIPSNQTFTLLAPFIQGDGWYECGVSAVSIEAVESEYYNVSKIFLVKNGVIINGRASHAPGKVRLE